MRWEGSRNASGCGYAPRRRPHDLNTRLSICLIWGVLLFSTFFLCSSILSHAATATPNATDPTPKVLTVYQDADLSHHIESSQAIQRGIEIAFSEVDFKIQGYRVEFKYLDHRGNVVRSLLNYKTFLKDPTALAIYSGIHSPPLINNREFINERGALTLVPWAAGGPITRYPGDKNWIFRASIDDTRAGGVIIDFAIKEKQCQSPHLLLEETPWGESNLRSMSKALHQHGIDNPAQTRFSWNLRDQAARFISRDIIERGDDCIILVANAIEGAILVNAMLELPTEQRLPIISHWGITGGNFQDRIDANKRSELDLHFIQSCFAFTQESLSPHAQEVLSRLTARYPEHISEPKDLKSAVGFIHAYDLSKILIQALNQVELSADMNKNREQVRKALENLNNPVHGLVKVYDKPFSSYHPTERPNAHEAIHSEHYCMARYGVNNEVIVIPQ